MVGAPVVQCLEMYMHICMGLVHIYAEKFTLILYLLLNKKAAVTFDEWFTGKTARTSQNTQMQRC